MLHRVSGESDEEGGVAVGKLLEQMYHTSHVLPGCVDCTAVRFIDTLGSALLLNDDRVRHAGGG